MHTWILLLRGINVGSNRSLPMRELVQDLESLGLENVATYIQSGNVVFQSSDKVSPTLQDDIGAAIEKRRGFRPTLLLVSAESLDEAIESNPFPEADEAPKSLHLYFLESKPSAPDLDRLETVRLSSERYHLDDRVFYLHTPDGYGKSKLASEVEKRLGVAATARNWRTVRKLQDMAHVL